jgi:hypothetical protein
LAIAGRDDHARLSVYLAGYVKRASQVRPLLTNFSEFRAPDEITQCPKGAP